VPPKPYADSSNVQGSTLAGGISANVAFLAARSPPQHRKLGRRRRRVRAEVFAPDLATVPFLADNLEPEPVCVAYWRRIWVAASAAPQQTATCVLRRLNTEICPAKGPVAVGAGVLSLIAFRRPRQPSWRWSWCRCRAPRTTCRAVSPGAFAASGGVSCLFLCCREVGGSFCAGPRRPPGPVRRVAAP
jgi:hypothetical protein